jgi:hypothetical protein
MGLSRSVAGFDQRELEAVMDSFLEMAASRDIVLDVPLVNVIGDDGFDKAIQTGVDLDRRKAEKFHRITPLNLLPLMNFQPIEPNTIQSSKYSPWTLFLLSATAGPSTGT